MTKAKIYNLEGQSTSEKKLKDEIFDVKLSPKIITQVINAQLANRRGPFAHSKTRAEVSGGGKKPYRQKGTGNARAGSSRSPIWIGGGITFGPRSNRNYHQRLPKKMRNKALRMIFTQKIKENKIIILKEIELKKYSTKDIESILQKLPIEEGKILVILPKMNVNLELSLANLPYLKTIQADSLNIIDLIKYDYLLTDIEGIGKIEKILLEGKKKAK